MSENLTREVQIGPWLGQTFNHFSAHWQKYMMPAIVMFVAQFGLLMVLGVVVAAAFFVGSAIDEDVLGPVLAAGTGLIGFLVFMLVMPALSVGFFRGIFAVNRGEEFGLDYFTAALKEIPSIAGLFIAILGAVGIGYMFCVIPGLIAATGLCFAVPIYAERRLGVVECLTESWEMAKPNLLMLLVYIFVAGMIGGIIQYIPLVGWVIAGPLISMFIMSAYLGMTGREGLKA